MTIPPATPDMPAVEVSHGVGALVLTLRDGRGRSLGTVLSPDGADDLAGELRTQAADARKLMAFHHPEARPPRLMLTLYLVVVLGGLALVYAWYWLGR